MAALVASPPVSPLAIPTTFLPEHQKEQPDTTSLFEGLLAGWAFQQSRSTSLERHLPLGEPSSYPFPSMTDVPCAELPQIVDYSEFTSFDYDARFGQPPLAAPVSSPSEHLTSNDIGNLPDNSIAWAEITGARVLGQELDNALVLPMDNDELFMQDVLSDFNDENLQKALSSPGVKPSDPAMEEPQLPPERATVTPFQFEPNSNISSPIFPVPQTQVASTVALDWTIAAPADEHYSKASSSRKRPKTKEWQHSRKLQYKDQKGSVIGTLITLGYDKASRRPYSAAERARTKDTRQRRACAACRTNKKRCDRPESEYECCDNCRSKVHSMPCFKAEIIGVELFRRRPSPTHPRGVLRHAVFKSLSDISHRPPGQPHITVSLTQDLGLQVLVDLARYEPIPGEVTHRVWKKDGQIRHIEMPPYCIANMRDAQRDMLEYIANFRSAWLKYVLGRSNDITRDLFDQAQGFAAFNPDSTVSKALDLCAASRIIERDWRICGAQEDLGIPLVSDDESNPFFNCIPITPMMDAQLDQIVIHSFLIPTRDSLLASLQAKMTSAARPSSFFEIFLTVSVLLSHAEWLLAHSRQNARRVGAKTRYNYIPRAEAYFHACNTFIAYWHHMCEGSSPAEMNWMDEGPRKWARLDEEQAQFLDSLKRRINADESKSMMLRLREENRYESELYWCHQIFFPNWKAGAKSVVDEVITS